LSISPDAVRTWLGAYSNSPTQRANAEKAKGPMANPTVAMMIGDTALPNAV